MYHSFKIKTLGLYFRPFLLPMGWDRMQRVRLPPHGQGQVPRGWDIDKMEGPWVPQFPHGAKLRFPPHPGLTTRLWVYG